MNSPSAVLLGKQEPRVSLIPTSRTNEADDAIYLTASYGLTPDEWQRSVLWGWLGRRPDGKWAASRCGLSVPRQNGKNGIVEMRELFGMVMLGERFLHTAHEVKTARKAFLRLLSFFENERQYPELSKLVKEIRKTNGQEAIVLHTGGSIEFVARSRGSGRGYSVDVLVMDEAQELTDEALAALLPTISASPCPQVIMTGTPPGPAANGEVFTRTRNAGVAGEDPRLCWTEWSCEGKPMLDDPAEWANANPALGIRLSAETIGDERAAFDDETFARERLGMWDASATAGVIDMAKWDSLVDVRSAPQDPVAFAVDISPDRTRASIGVAGFRPDGLAHVEVIESTHGMGWVTDRLVDLQTKWKPCAIVVDPGGPAGGLLAELDKAEVDTVKVSGREYAQACGAFYDAVVADGRVRHLGDKRLTAAVDAGRKRPLGDAWAWHRRDPNTDITPLVAATLALHGLDVHGQVKPKSKAAFGF